MSINIFAFLGNETGNLDARFIQAFADLGFDVALHPEFSLTGPSVRGSLYLKVMKTPPQMLRIAPAHALLIEFEYDVIKREKKLPRSMGWPPKGVGNYSYEATSRTSSGRSDATAAMQLLSMAILAKETGGAFYADDDDAASKGALALQQSIQGLDRFDQTHFDAYAYAFKSWPPVDGDNSFTWGQQIVPPEVALPLLAKRRPQFGYKFSWLHVPGILLVMYFLVMTLVYS